MIYEENPLHVEIIPIAIANKVRIHVESEPIIEEKNEHERNYCKDRIIMGIYLLLLLSIFGGFTLFLVWIYTPYVFGSRNSY